MTSFAVDALKQAREDANDRLREVEALARELRARIKDFDAAIDALSVNVTASEPKTAKIGTMKDMVFRIVEASEGEINAHEIHKKLIDIIGRDVSINSLLSTLSRITRDGLNTSPRRGVWQKARDEEGPAEAGPDQDVGGVAERMNAPGSKSGGALPGKSAPAGSNPAASAPLHRNKGDLLAGVSFAAPTNPTPPWRR